MLRSIYICLLRWHPACFRRRFADEMLADFDNAGGGKDELSLILDGIVSLIRQWASRPHRLPAEVGVSEGPLLFQTIEDYRLSTSSMVKGTLLSTAILCAAILAIGHGGAKNPLLLVGAHFSRPGLITLDRASLIAQELDTQIRFPSRREDPWQAIAAVYFKIIRVLGSLDVDQDYRISSRELRVAATILLELDTDRDGKLSPEECGLVLGPGARANMAPDLVERIRQQFMRANPSLAALDVNLDGELSQGEIRNARASLRRLDRNGDGLLSPDETIPDLVSNQVSMILSRLDKNGDDKLSMGERLDSEADSIRKIVESADRNHDGLTTRQELIDRLQLNHEVKRQIDRAMRATQ